MTPVNQTDPVAPWLGGKRNLARRICAAIDATPCTTYAEPFVGMGGIFLRRTRRPKAEVINDRGRDVANLFRILQRHYVAFLDTLRFQLTTRAEFERLVATDPDTLTDLERAVGAPVNKAGSAKRAPVKKAPVKKAPVKKAPAKKAVKKAPDKKKTAKKPAKKATKKATTKKPAARKTVKKAKKKKK